MNNKYILEMTFNTQNEYKWTIVPSNFNYHNGIYQYRIIFNSREEAITWSETYIPVLINSLQCENHLLYTHILNDLSALNFHINQVEYSYFVKNYFDYSISFEPYLMQYETLPILSANEKFIIFQEQDKFHRYLDLCDKVAEKDLTFTETELRKGLEYFDEVYNMDISENNVWDYVINTLEEEKNAKLD